MSVPNIKTAIPARRYQYGEFMITVLQEIESDDPVNYRYIMAVATERDPAPGLFICAERDGGGYRLRVAMADGAQILGSSPAFGDIELFVKEGLGVVGTMLNLTDEIPHQLM